MLLYAMRRYNIVWYSIAKYSLCYSICYVTLCSYSKISIETAINKNSLSLALEAGGVYDDHIICELTASGAES